MNASRNAGTVLRVFWVGWIGLSLFASPVQAQKTHTDWAWRPLFEYEGVSFTYLFYSRADNENNGVVIKIANTNAFAVDYQFKVIFRAEDAEHVEQVSGSLAPGQVKTGDADGLFWIPFKDGKSIGEVGIRGYKIVPRDTVAPS